MILIAFFLNSHWENSPLRNLKPTAVLISSVIFCIRLSQAVPDTSSSFLLTYFVVSRMTFCLFIVLFELSESLCN